MCILYAILLLLRARGGKVMIVIKPSLHIIVCCRGRILHGTNHGGPWRVEEIDRRAFGSWVAS